MIEDNAFGKSSTVVYHSGKFDILRLEVPGWDELSPGLKKYIYHLSEACLWGRDIIYIQHHRQGLLVRELLEAIWQMPAFRTKELEEYLAQYWFHSGLYHSYEETKFLPEFSVEWFKKALEALPYDIDTFLGEAGTNRSDIIRLLFDADYEGLRRASGAAETLIERSSVNFYDRGITTKEAVDFYERAKGETELAPGLNSVLRKSKDGEIFEERASTSGLYAPALEEIVLHLRRASLLAPSEKAKSVLQALIAYYETGDPDAFATYSKMWVHLVEEVDMINGFIETYTDPLGLKGSWEGIVELEDKEGTKRTEKIISLADRLEKASPTDEAHKRKKAGAVSNRSINAVLLAGDSYPASPLGINLPNDERIRAEEGSKSVTLANVSKAISAARSGKSIPVYFFGKEVQDRQRKYGSLADILHTDLHEGIGHASGRLLDGVRGDALREFDSVIEEARADLNALYFIAHPILREEGIVESEEVYKALYDGYLTRGLLSQLARVGEVPVLTEAHMQDRALIARWTIDLAKETGAVTLEERDGRHYVFVNDYRETQRLFGEELREIQRIKSTGDYAGAKELIERYATHVDEALLTEIKERDKATGIPPYTGFVNPVLTQKAGEVIELHTGEDFFAQNLRYSKEYKSLVSPLSRYGKRLREDEGKWKPLLDSLRTQLRRLMDVKVAQSMKSKGLAWKTLYGSNLLKLKELSATLPKDEELSGLLWHKENREMRLLALMTLPRESAEKLYPVLSEEVRTVEEAEQLVDLVLIPSKLSGVAVGRIPRENSSVYTRLIPYILLTRLLTLKEEVPSSMRRAVLKLVTEDLRDGDQRLAVFIHRTFVKTAESGVEGRGETALVIRQIRAEFGADTTAFAIAEDLDDLIRYLEKEESNGSKN
ncbi:MAG: dipeptidyl peptidase 3 [Bacteroidales bacterium]|nr:dipeptidyl peptidase 3 [Bacteroidales bacterium]